MGESRHLDEIISRHNQIANAQIVVFDIEKYSKRRTLAQVDAVARFTTCLTQALHDVAKNYVEYAQGNDINFETDIIRLPTGDGAFVGFTFEGLSDIHLTFARAMLRHADAARNEEPCEKFDEAGWCNCHSHFNLRVGVTEGKSVVYRDVNGGYNLAGDAMNLAVRVMAQGDPNQIFLSDVAYSQLVDLSDDPALTDNFRSFSDVEIKHGHRISLHQYTNRDDHFLNSGEPVDLQLLQEMKKTVASMGGPLAFPDMDKTARARAVLQMAQEIAKLQAAFGFGTGGAVQPGTASPPPLPSADEDASDDKPDGKS